MNYLSESTRNQPGRPTRAPGSPWPVRLVRLVPLLPAGLGLSCCENPRHEGPSSRPNVERSATRAKPIDPSDPAVQESVMRGYNITNPVVQELVKGLMQKHYPERLSTRRDIELANAAATQIDIRDLPIRDYPLLGRFTRVTEIDLDSRQPVATDEHLTALASLDFPDLVCLTLDNCRAVTDEGIRALSRIASLRELALEGTSITDAACQVMAHSMRLTAVNVANCGGVTFRGLRALADSDTLKEVSFSADHLAPAQVILLLASFRNVTWCGIVDLTGKLDADAVTAKGAERKIQVVVSRTGALQDTWQAHD